MYVLQRWLVACICEAGGPVFGAQRLAGAVKLTCWPSLATTFMERMHLQVTWDGRHRQSGHRAPCPLLQLQQHWRCRGQGDRCLPQRLSYCTLAWGSHRYVFGVWYIQGQQRIADVL